MKGFVPLSDYSSVEIWPDRKHAFKLFHKSNEDARKFFIQAKDDDEMQDWMRLLAQGIDVRARITLENFLIAISDSSTSLDGARNFAESVLVSLRFPVSIFGPFRKASCF